MIDFAGTANAPSASARELAQAIVETPARGGEIYRGVQMHCTAGVWWFVAASDALVASEDIGRVRSEIDSQVWLLDLQSEIQRERRN